MSGTSYDQAMSIATYTTGLLADLRRQRDLPAVNRIYAGWLDYARTHSVCKQIRESVAMARSEMEW